jgi:hypothetical protein
VTALVEHGELFPLASVALAWKVVVELSGTVTAIPGEASSAAVPLATGAPEQSEVENSPTVVPGGAVPRSLGVLLAAGPTGELPLSVGTGGSASTSRMRWLLVSAIR